MGIICYYTVYSFIKRDKLPDDLTVLGEDDVNVFKNSISLWMRVARRSSGPYNDHISDPRILRYAQGRLAYVCSPSVNTEFL